jgi:hypothetical protein
MEKRNRRISVDINCWLEGREGMYCVSTFDLSETGVSVLCSDPVPEGRILTLKFFTPFSVEPITVQGEVIWSCTDPEARMGLRFIGMNEMTKGILKSTAQLLRTREQMEKI